MRPTPGIVALLALALAGCGGSQAKQEPNRQPAASPSVLADPLADPLAGRTFTAEEATVDGSPRLLLPGAELTFTVHGVLGATGGCNGFAGEVGTRDGRLEFPEDTPQTLRGCGGEAEEQDAWLRELLEADPDWRLDGDQLVLTSGDTELVLTDTTMPNPELAGTSWTLVDTLDADGETHAVAGPATVTFTEETVEVDTGCNTGSAGYTATDTTIRLDDLALTRRACQGEAMRVEQTVVETLRGEVRHRVDDQTLRIAHPSGTGLTLGRNPR